MAEWPFVEVSRTRAPGGPKTAGAEIITWVGRFGDKRLTIVSRPRTIDPHAHFHVSSNARICPAFNRPFACYVDLCVDQILSEEERDGLRAVAAQFDDRPVRVRCHGEAVR